MGSRQIAVKGPKVLVVPPSYFSEGRTVGGGERYAFEYARALSRSCDTTLALFGPKGSLTEEGSLKVRIFPTRGPTEGLFFPVTKSTWRDLAFYDVIHAMVFPTPLTDLLLLASRIHRQKLVLTDVGGGGRCVSAYFRRLSARLDPHRMADGVAMQVLYGGVDLERFCPRDIEQRGGYLLFVGRLLPHKGILELIEAVQTDIPLRIVGNPYDKTYYEAVLRAINGRKNIELFLNSNEDQLVSHYQCASAVVQPSLELPSLDGSKAELLGLATIEGMACGKPALVTRTASLPELVVDGVTGWIVDPHDVASLRARAVECFQNFERTLLMGRNARAHAEKCFSWDAAALRGEEFYKALFAPSRML
jgi:glycosyltransferase involved in cell wall biosynthesis